MAFSASAGERADGVLRLSVVSEGRRVDVACPAHLPVAELMPQLAAHLGAGGDWPLSCRVATHDGRLLVPEMSLAAQGIRQAGLLLVVDPARARPDTYEEEVQVVAELPVDVPALAPTRRLVAQLGAIGLGLLGVLGLVLPPGVPSPVSVAGAVSVSLLAIALLSARGSELGSASGASTGVAWLGCLYAATAGLLVQGRVDSLTEAFSGAVPPISVAGAVLAASGVLMLVTISAHRLMMLPVVLAGMTTLLCGIATGPFGCAPPSVAAAVLTAVTLTGGAAPRVALAATSLGRGCPPDEGSSAVARIRGPALRPVLERSRVIAEARFAADLLAALIAGEGLVLVLAAPLVAALGWWGVALTCCAAWLLILRSAKFRALATYLAGTISGLIMGISAVVVGLFATSERPLVLGSVTVVAVATLGSATLGTRPTRWRLAMGRWVESLETVLATAMLPTLLLSLSVFDLLGNA